MPQRLDITNGDNAVATLESAAIGGRIVPWRDVLHEGPVDSSLSLADLSEQRARFIAGNGWADIARVSADFRERDRALHDLDDIDEIVLWFEDDLYDQLQLIQILAFFADGSAEGKELSLIQVDGYIPPLSAAKLKELDRERKRVTHEQLELARRAWNAFGSSDPNSVAALSTQDTSALPYLAAAFRRILEEFPSTTNGLSRSERETLTAIKAGHDTPVQAFLEVARQQESIFLGDSVFYGYLERLSQPGNALLTWRDGAEVVAPDANGAREFVQGQLTVTPLGSDVLAGKRDWQTITTKARWLGGVEIPPSPDCWRWNSGTQTLLRPGTN